MYRLNRVIFRAIQIRMNEYEMHNIKRRSTYVFGVHDSPDEHIAWHSYDICVFSLIYSDEAKCCLAFA